MAPVFDPIETVEDPNPTWEIGAANLVTTEYMQISPPALNSAFALKGLHTSLI